MKAEEITSLIGLGILGAWLAPKYIKSYADVYKKSKSAWEISNAIQKTNIIVFGYLTYFAFMPFQKYLYLKYLERIKYLKEIEKP